MQKILLKIRFYKMFGYNMPLQFNEKNVFLTDIDSFLKLYSNKSFQFNLKKLNFNDTKEKNKALGLEQLSMRKASTSSKLVKL